MSTRAYIFAEIPSDMYGKSINFDASKLPATPGKYSYEKKCTVPVEVQERIPLYIPQSMDSNVQNGVRIVGPKYVGIYYHSDGYPDGVGRELESKYDSIDKVLNLIAGGNCSCLWDYYEAYIDRYPDSARDEQPTFELDVNEILSEYGDGNIEYIYVFRSGKWSVYSIGDNYKKARTIEQAVKLYEKSHY